jgi:endonuclease/exonuclease/phosphatase family metal-dependent hydrolase
MLSRWPMLSHHQICLRLHDTKKPRGAQMAVIDSPEGPVHVVNWHLGLSERERHWQVRHLLGHHLFQEGIEFPTVIAGDFNDWRNTLARGPFEQYGFQHVTAPPSRFRTFPAYLPIGSLDKAFFRGNVHIQHARVVHSDLARAASDHLPLVIDFHLQEGPRTTSS